MRIVIIGGGSYHWSPTLLADIHAMPSLADAEIVLQDIDPAPLPAVAAYAEKLRAATGARTRVRTTTDQRDALRGADAVVVTISTGGFDSMRHDLEVPERFGIRQSVGDTVGPGGISRALRNVPVLVGIARDMAELCPDAWMLNITNPMTTLCRAVTGQTQVRCVGLCHEVHGTLLMLSGLLGRAYGDFVPTVTGVNHLPVMTSLRAGEDDGFALLRAALAALSDVPAEERSRSWSPAWIAEHHRLKLARFVQDGVLLSAGDRHLVEFFPDHLTEETGWGKEWNVELTTIADREMWLDYFRAVLAQQLSGQDPLPDKPSGEMVAPVLDSLVTGTRRVLPLNLPNTGQAVGLPERAVVETMCAVDADGVHATDPVAAPAPYDGVLARHVEVQELTVQAALAGDRDLVVEALRRDPLAGRDPSVVAPMADALLDANARWLPQFAA